MTPRIVLLAYGSRGDVQPFVALGRGLVEAGFQVRLAAPRIHADFVTSYSLDFSPLAGDPVELSRLLVEKGDRNWLAVVRAVAGFAIPLATEVLANIETACQGADAVVHSFLLTIAGHEAAVRLDVPDFSAHFFPVFAETAAFPAVMLPALPLGGRYNRLTHRLSGAVFWGFSRLAYGWLRRQHSGLPPLSGWPFKGASAKPTPILFAFSPSIVPRPPDWGPEIHVTGNWFLDSPEWQPPMELQSFLDAGDPPIYVGFGSVVADRAAELTAIILEALAESGQRGLLNLGWGGMRVGALPARFLAIREAPHEWLFPRMRALIHHGGAGTTAAGLRSGVPNIVVPMASDQSFWAGRVQALGAGIGPLSPRKLTAGRLADAIREVLDSSAIRQQAENIGQTLRREDGIRRAVEIISARI